MFVHARNATVKTATALRDLASSSGDSPLFVPDQSAQLGFAEKQVCYPLAHTYIYIVDCFPCSTLQHFLL